MNKSNQQLTFQGNKITVTGREIHEGDMVPSFKVVGVDMKEITEAMIKGKPTVILSVPSLDTPVCSTEVQRFNSEATTLSPEVQVLVVSMDLPFAQKRWCGAQGTTRVVTGSDYKDRGFGESFGTSIKDNGLLARAVFVVGRDGKVKHVEYVKELSAEPDYQAALSALKAA